MIDALEERDAAVTEIPGTYLHADMDEDFYICLEDMMAEIMAKTELELLPVHSSSKLSILLPRYLIFHRTHA